MVQKITKQRGRPRHFKESEALEGATKVFWEKGYDGATIDDLVEGTGIGRPSLYATFGDKETLFLRCLNYYGEWIGSLTLKALQAPTDVQEAIRAFLHQSVKNATGECSPRGCMMGCVAPAVEDPKIRAFVAASMAGAAQAIEARFAAAVTAGQLPADFPCALRGRQVTDMSMALALRARVGASREELLRDADEGVLLLCPASKV